MFSQFHRSCFCCNYCHGGNITQMCPDVPKEPKSVGRLEEFLAVFSSFSLSSEAEEKRLT